MLPWHMVGIIFVPSASNLVLNLSFDNFCQILDLDLDLDRALIDGITSCTKSTIFVVLIDWSLFILVFLSMCFNNSYLEPSRSCPYSELHDCCRPCCILSVFLVKAGYDA